MVITSFAVSHIAGRCIGCDVKLEELFAPLKCAEWPLLAKIVQRVLRLPFKWQNDGRESVSKQISLDNDMCNGIIDRKNDRMMLQAQDGIVRWK